MHVITSNPANQATPHAGDDTMDLDLERRWIEASRRGDTDSFNKLVLRWEEKIYNLALRMLADPQDAADVTQDIFLLAYRNIGRFRMEARFSTWLYRIAANTCLTARRRTSRSIRTQPLDEETPTHWLARSTGHEQEAGVRRREQQEQILKALRRLPPDRRLVVELRVYQEQSFQEIAQVLEVPVSTAKSRFYTALTLLQGWISPEIL